MQYLYRFLFVTFVGSFVTLSLAEASQKLPQWSTLDEREHDEKTVPLLSVIDENGETPHLPLGTRDLSENRVESVEIVSENSGRTACYGEVESPDKIDSFNTWFESHVLHKDASHCFQKNVSKIVDGIFALSGSAVFVCLSYKFGNVTLKGGIPTGVVFSALTSVSPVLGYSKLNFPYYDALLVPQDGRKEIAYKVKPWRDLTVESLMCITNVLGALPIAYASHQSFLNLIDPVATWMLDVPAFVSIYLVYDITARKTMLDLKGFFYSKKSTITRDPGLFDIKEARSILFVHLQKLLEKSQKLSDERMNDIYHKVHQDRREDLNLLIDPRILSLLSFLSTQEDPQQRKKSFSINREEIIGYIGGIVGLVGSYYFYEMGSQAIVDICTGIGIDPSASDVLGIIGGALAFGSRGVFSFVTTQQTCKNLYGYVKNLCCGASGQTVVQKILVPVSLTLLATARSVPNVQMSFEYLGMDNWHELALGVCTALATFSGSFWTLKAFTDAHFRTEIQARRAIIQEEIKEMIYILPYLKVEPLIELLRTLRVPKTEYL
jgi:hypothetical protein